MGDKCKQVKYPGLREGSSTYSGSAVEVIRKAKKCQHEWRTPRGCQTECENCGMPATYLLQQAEQQVDELTARLAKAEDQRDQWEAEYSVQKDMVTELIAELKGMGKAKDTFYNDMLLYKKSCDDLIKLRDELTARAEKAEAEATKLDNSLHQQVNRAFQAEGRVKVLEGALEPFRNIHIKYGKDVIITLSREELDRIQKAIAGEGKTENDNKS